MDLRITSAWRNSQQADTIQFMIKDDSGAMRRINLPKSANRALYEFIEQRITGSAGRSPAVPGQQGAQRLPLGLLALTDAVQNLQVHAAGDRLAQDLL
jgi:hypothetical protein